MTETDYRAVPKQIPPVESPAAQAEAPGMTAPTLNEQQMAVMAQESAPVPTMAPPTAAAEAAAAAGVTAVWRTNVRIDGLWLGKEPRNGWAHVVGLGWRKIYNGRDGAFQALMTLAGQARQTNRTANLREESDGMIYEIYLW